MTDARKILEMIENVAVDDVAALDEIDARVWCSIYGEEYVGRNVSGKECFRNRYNGMTPTAARRARKYTRSRDALKAIRPDSWVMNVSPMRTSGMSVCGYIASISLYPTYLDTIKILPTEELAELHAILQALDHARNASKGGV
jgi:hypothetical protein